MTDLELGDMFISCGWLEVGCKTTRLVTENPVPRGWISLGNQFFSRAVSHENES